MGTTSDAPTSALERRADAQRSLQQKQRASSASLGGGGDNDDVAAGGVGPTMGGGAVASQHAELPPTIAGDGAVGDAAGDNTGPGGQPRPEELDAFVGDLLEQMQSRFAALSEGVIGRIDKMGGRIDDLERSISDLMDQAGVDRPSPLSNPNGGARNGSVAGAAGIIEHGGGATMSNGDAGSPDRST